MLHITDIDDSPPKFVDAEDDWDFYVYENLDAAGFTPDTITLQQRSTMMDDDTAVDQEYHFSILKYVATVN